MNLEQISFNEMPEALGYLIKKVEQLEKLLSNQNHSQPEQDQWFNLEDLKNYHPDHPASPTVYAWVSQRLIPFHKKGKKLMFLKSEIDSYLKSGRRKTIAEIRDETQKQSNILKGGLK